MSVSSTLGILTDIKREGDSVCVTAIRRITVPTEPRVTALLTSDLSREVLRRPSKKKQVQFGMCSEIFSTCVLLFLIVSIKRISNSRGVFIFQKIM